MGLPRSTAEVIVGICIARSMIMTLDCMMGLAITALGNGCGITTSLISLIANAGQVDQAIATAGL